VSAAAAAAASGGRTAAGARPIEQLQRHFSGVITGLASEQQGQAAEQQRATEAISDGRGGVGGGAMLAECGAVRDPGSAGGCPCGWVSRCRALRLLRTLQTAADTTLHCTAPDAPGRRSPTRPLFQRRKKRGGALRKAQALAPQLCELEQLAGDLGQRRPHRSDVPARQLHVDKHLDGGRRLLALQVGVPAQGVGCRVCSCCRGAGGWGMPTGPLNAACRSAAPGTPSPPPATPAHPPTHQIQAACLSATNDPLLPIQRPWPNPPPSRCRAPARAAPASTSRQPPPAAAPAGADQDAVLLQQRVAHRVQPPAVLREVAARLRQPQVDQRRALGAQHLQGEGGGRGRGGRRGGRRGSEQRRAPGPDGCSSARRLHQHAGRMLCRCWRRPAAPPHLQPPRLGQLGPHGARQLGEPWDPLAAPLPDLAQRQAGGGGQVGRLWGGAC
jgi:hypothetical protein